VQRAIVGYQPAPSCDQVDREWDPQGWCHVYRGDVRLARGEQATLALDLCRTGAAAGGSGQLRFPTQRQGSFTVIDSSGRPLWSSDDSPSTFRAGEILAIRTGTCARWTIRWDGRDRSDRRLSAGTYRLLLATNGDEQSTTGRPYAGSIALTLA